jgi:signal transduction histidine kinase
MLREMADTLGGLAPLLTGLDEAIQSWRAAANEEVALVRSGRQEEAIAIVGSGVPKERFDLVRQRSADLDEFLARIVDARSARQNALERWVAVGGAIVVVAGVVVVVSTHRWLGRSVTRPLATLTGAVAGGDARPFDVVAGGGAAGEISALARGAEQFRSTKDRERHEAVLAATQSERRRVAADLHDGPVQTLFALQLALRQLGGRLRRQGDPGGAEVADEGVAVLESTQAQLRWMMFALAPPGLGHRPFVDVLADTLPQILEPPARLRIDAPRDIEVDQSTQGILYRVIVEAIRNVNKHAAASEVRILITPVGSTVDVEITDDGMGFEPARAAAVGHVGLDNMRSMVESVDGIIEIVSAPGAGTRIHVIVPA